MTLNKKNITQNLKNRSYNIRFIKADGKERTIQATLCENLIPNDEYATYTRQPLNANIITVFDQKSRSKTPGKAWRSITIDSIIEIS